MKINITEKKIKKKMNFFKKQRLLDALIVLVISIRSEGANRVVHSYLSDLEKVEDSINYYLTKKNITEINKIGHRYNTISETFGAVFLVDLFI